MSSNTKQKLHDLHGLLTDYFLEEIQMSREEGIPMMSSTLSVIVTFLKNNEITADVRDDFQLAELREQILSKANTPEERGAKLVEVASKTAEIMGYEGVVN